MEKCFYIYKTNNFAVSNEYAMPNKKNNSSALNILRLEFLLRGDKLIKVERLAMLLNVSERQVYRYISEIRKQGKVELENEGDTYRIFEKNNYADINSTEELILLYHAIQNNSLDHLQTQKILKIITQSTALWKRKDVEREKKIKKFTEVIKVAIYKKKKVLIKGYKSRDSDPSDRIVTPVLLDEELNKLYGLENGNGYCFNFERITGKKVELLKKNAEPTENWNPFEDADPFGFLKPHDNRALIDVQVTLNEFAYSLLIRQFPVMSKYLTDYKNANKNYTYLLTISVWDIQPIARFCVGLLHSVKILGSDDAIRQIKDYADSKVIKEGYNKNFFSNI